MCVTIHDLVPHREEGFLGERLGKEVSYVIHCTNVRNTEQTFLHLLSNKEMTALDMLDLIVVFRVVRESNGCLVVTTDCDGVACTADCDGVPRTSRRDTRESGGASVVKLVEP